MAESISRDFPSARRGPVSGRPLRSRRRLRAALAVVCAGALAACGQAPSGPAAMPAATSAATAQPLEAPQTEASTAAATAPPPAAAAPAAAAPAFDTVLRVVGGACNDPAHEAGCTAGDYDLVLHPGCGADGLFAGVSEAAGATLIDAAPPNDTTKRATLAKGQLVCVQATANAGESPAWYYVSAMPVAGVAACAGNKLCAMYGDRDVVWLDARPLDDCATLGAPLFKGRCVSGWTRADDLDLFSNGL